MRNPFYIFLSLIFLFSCNKKENETLSIKVSNVNISEINLTLKDYNANKNKNFIDIKIENLISPIEEQLRISDEGIVNYTFLNNNKREIIFNYDGRKFSLVISPLEKINIELKISELVTWSKLSHIKVSGINQTTNHLILSSTSYLDSLIQLSASSSVNDTSLTNYKNRRLAEMKNQLLTFNNYIIDNKIKDITFIDWAKAQIRYKAGTDLSLYPFMGKRSINLKVEDEYFDFLSDIKFNFNDELVYDSYLNYLEILTRTFIIMGNVGEAYSYKKKLLKMKWPTPYFLKLELVKKLPKGRDREIMMAYIFKDEQRISKQSGEKIPIEYSDSLELYSNKTLVAQLNLAKKNDKTSILKLIEDYELSQEEKKELIDIYKRAEGKVVFHDFWFTNCAPCMKELPNYNNLMKIAGKNVVFVLLGVNMDENDWNKTREKFDLKGVNYLLSKNQLAFYEKYFEIHGFPHHQIINSKGQIVKEYIPRVYEENFKNLTALIEKHKN